jgi:hypothetical protein
MSTLADSAAIQDLFTRYCCALDNGKIEAVVDCFTVDAILESPARLKGWQPLPPGRYRLS